MEPFEITREVCRICLEQKENINWNDKIKEFCEISYKDCYYRYTQLDEPDPDYYPTNLCDRCAKKLKDTHNLFEMALESFKILQNTFKTKELNAEYPFEICNSSQEIICESRLLDDKAHLEIDEVMCFSSAYESSFKENELNEIVYEENSESSIKIALDNDSFNVKLLKSLVADREKNNERKNLDVCETTLELNLQLEIHGSYLFKATDKKNKTNACKSLYQSPKKKKIKKMCAIKSVAQQKVKHNAMIHRTRNNHEKLSSPISHLNNLQLSKSPATKISDEPTYELSDHFLLDSNIDDEHINTEVHLNTKSKNQIDPSNYPDVLKDTDSLNSLTQKQIKPKESQKLSVSDISIKKDEKAMLEEIYGKEFDINALMGRKPQKRRELMCQYCSVKVNGASHLKSHEFTHLENRERNIICTKCGMKFYTKESLNAHQKIYDENRQKKHKCEFCDKAFFHRGALNVHRRIHLGLMVKCQLCPKEFCRQIDLDRHLPTHSATALQSNGMSVKQKKYTVQCQYCNESVLTTKWRAHKAAHLNEPQVKCKICDKDFFSRHSCYRHIKKTHRKTRGEIEENIHSYVDWSRRMSHLMMVQQERLKALTQ